MWPLDLHPDPSDCTCKLHIFQVQFAPFSTCNLHQIGANPWCNLHLHLHHFGANSGANSVQMALGFAPFWRNYECKWHMDLHHLGANFGANKVQFAP